MNKKLVKPRVMIVSCLLLATVAFVSGQPGTTDAPLAAQSETRCGWFSNPTPANASLHDRDAEWIIGCRVGIRPQATGRSLDVGNGCERTATTVTDARACECGSTVRLMK